MKDLINEGRNLQDNFKKKLVKESPIQIAPIDTIGQTKIVASSKLDKHYKINHPTLTLLKIEQSSDPVKSLSSSQLVMNMIFGIKSPVTNSNANPETLMRDASKIARMICNLLDNYNTDHNPGRPMIKDKNIIIPIKVTTWTGD